jgi:uncharacterized protein (TIGR00369 family)
MSEPAPKLDAAAIQAIFDRSPFIAFMGIKVLAVDHEKESFSARMPLRAELQRSIGAPKQFHGGPVAAFIDTVGDFAVGMVVGSGVPTMNLRIDYLRPAVGDYLDAIARIRRLGKTTAVVDVDVLAPDGQLVAIGRGTFVPLRG